MLAGHRLAGDQPGEGDRSTWRSPIALRAREPAGDLDRAAELLGDLADQRPSSGVSPGSTLPPGSSQRPAVAGGVVRRAASTRPPRSTAAPTTGLMGPTTASEPPRTTAAVYGGDHADGAAEPTARPDPAPGRAPDPHGRERRRDRRARRRCSAAGSGCDGVLDDLNRRGRRALAPGRAVHRALTWDREDRRTPQWWPQGISTSADASDTEEIAGRRLVVVTWYAKPARAGEHPGSRITFLDLDSRRYRHVLLVVPELADGRRARGSSRCGCTPAASSGAGPTLHVAATGRGFVTCRVDDLLRVPDARGRGPRPARASTATGCRRTATATCSRCASPTGPHAEQGQERLRYSFLSLDRQRHAARAGGGRVRPRHADPAAGPLPARPGEPLLGEARTGRRGRCCSTTAACGQTQGAAVAGGALLPHDLARPGRRPGSVHVGHARAPSGGTAGRRRWARRTSPTGPRTDLLWSVTEHPRRRWVFSMRRSWFD